MALAGLLEMQVRMHIESRQHQQYGVHTVLGWFKHALSTFDHARDVYERKRAKAMLEVLNLQVEITSYSNGNQKQRNRVSVFTWMIKEYCYNSEVGLLGQLLPHVDCLVRSVADSPDHNHKIVHQHLLHAMANHSSHLWETPSMLRSVLERWKEQGLDRTAIKARLNEAAPEPLLHTLARKGLGPEFFFLLVNEYGADMCVLNEKGLTILQVLIENEPNSPYTTYSHSDKLDLGDTLFELVLQKIPFNWLIPLGKEGTSELPEALALRKYREMATWHVLSHWRQAASARARTAFRHARVHPITHERQHESKQIVALEGRNVGFLRSSLAKLAPLLFSLQRRTATSSCQHLDHVRGRHRRTARRRARSAPGPHGAGSCFAGGSLLGLAHINQPRALRSPAIKKKNWNRNKNVELQVFFILFCSLTCGIRRECIGAPKFCKSFVQFRGTDTHGIVGGRSPLDWVVVVLDHFANLALEARHEFRWETSMRGSFE